MTEQRDLRWSLVVLVASAAVLVGALALAVSLGWPLAMPVVAAAQVLAALGWTAVACVPVVGVGLALAAVLLPGRLEDAPALRAGAVWALGWVAVIGVGLVLLASGLYSPLVWQAGAALGWVGFVVWLARMRWRPLLRLWGELRSRWKGLSSAPLLSWRSVLVVLLLIAVAQAVVPPNTRDELAYHLVLPRLWAADGSWWGPADNPHLLFPANTELVWAYAGAVGGVHAPRLVTLLFALLTVGMLWEWLGQRWRPRWLREQSLLFLVATPVALTTAPICYVEWPLLFFLILGWRLAEHGSRDGDRRLLPVVTLAWGAAAGTKYTAVPFVGLLAVEWLIRLHRGRRGGGLQAVALLAVAVGVLAGPWWLRNAVLTGDPIHPLGRSMVAGSSDSATAARLANYADVPQGWRLAKWAYHATADPVSDHRLHPLWPVLLVLVLAFGWRWWRDAPWIAVVGATAVFAPFQPAPRIVLPLMVLAWLFLPFILAPLERLRWAPIATGAAVGAVVVLSLPFSVHYFFMSGSRAPQDYLVGRIDRVAFLRADGLVTPTIHWVRSGTPEDTRVWAWCWDRTLYLDRWARADSPYGPPAFLRGLNDGGPERLTAELERDRIDLVVLDRRACPESWTHAEAEGGRWEIAPEQADQLSAWSRQHLREVVRDDRYIVFSMVR